MNPVCRKCHRLYHNCRCKHTAADEYAARRRVVKESETERVLREINERQLRHYLPSTRQQ